MDRRQAGEAADIGRHREGLARTDVASHWLVVDATYLEQYLRRDNEWITITATLSKRMYGIAMASEPI
jgi:hypothetical protein